MTPTAIAVAVVVAGGRVLVGTRHPLSREGPGLDEFPGGKVEPGETRAAAAAREALEETGLEVVIGPLIDVAAGTASFGPIEVSFFLARPLHQVDAGAIESLPEPIPPFRWIEAGGLASLSFPGTNARVVAMLAEGRLESVGPGFRADRIPPDSTDGSGRSS